MEQLVSSPPPSPAKHLPPRSLSVPRSVGTRLKSVLLSPFRALGQALVGWICDKARYPIVYLWFHSYNVATCAIVAAKLGVFDLLKTGPKTADELARLTGANGPTLYRVLRGLASLRFLRQTGPETFALSPQGELLCQDHPRSLYHWAVHWGDDVLPVLPRFEDFVKTGETNAFELVHSKSYWEYLNENPKQAHNFNLKMSHLTEQHVAAVVAAYDFSKAGTLVDVGGGHGALLCEILKKYPQTKGILYDRPEVEPTAKDFIAGSNLTDRCTIATGSFLESVPKGGETYLLKHVLHDWDDKHVRSILKNVRAAMLPGQRLLIIEGFVEHEHFGSDVFRKWADIYQMVYLPGKERTLGEIHTLLTEAGFQMESLTPTAIVDVGILQTVAV